jgi:acetyl esterase/lipase
VELLVPFTAQPVILRIYNAAGSGRRPALVYLHGGLFNIGRIEEYASPLRSRRLAGITSTLLITTGSAPMRNEVLLYVNRLKEAGIHGQPS